MTMGESLTAYLLSITELTDLIGTSLFPVVAEQGVSNPVVVYSISNIRVELAMQSDPDCNIKTVQLSIFADRYSEVEAISKILVENLRDFKGQMGGGVTINAVNFLNENDEYDEEIREYIKYLEFVFYY